MMKLKQTILKFTTICMLVAGVAACAHTAVPHNSAGYQATHLLNSDQACPVNLTLKVGETLQFNAPENPSTGYMWALQAPLSLFKTTSHTVKDQTKQPSAPMVGVGQTRQFEFTALRAGQENIQLNYLRAWEKNVKPVKAWQCQVTVVEAQ